MAKQTDWIRRWKTVYTKNLPNGFSIHVDVNIHESGKITVTLNCSVVIGSFPSGFRSNFGELGDTMGKMSKIMRTRRRV